MLNIIKQFSDLSINIRQNEILKNHTTFKIGGPAKYFCVIDDYDQLMPVLKCAKKNNLDILIIGGGSNMLIADAGYNGLVIKFNIKEIKFIGQSVILSPDFPLGQLVGLAAVNNLSGLEFATGIPGTIGGAIVGNAGAYGGEMAEVVEKVEVIDEFFKKIILTKADLKFRYRTSILKNTAKILIKAHLSLKPGNFQKSAEIMKVYALDRFNKHPQQPSAGSTFKNIILTGEIEQNLRNKSLEIPEKFIEYQKIPVAWLIEQLGLKGFKIGGAQISEKHANHLINLGTATADNVVQLISLIKMKVRDELGIQLEEEIRYIGF